MTKVERDAAGEGDALPEGTQMNRITKALASLLTSALCVSTVACDTAEPEEFQLPGEDATTERSAHENGLMMKSARRQ